MSDTNGSSGFTPPSIEELNQGLSGYEIIDLIACGGMGAVYRARQISLDRIVAIKILPPELAVDETFRKSFEAEGKAMAKLSHSNLVGVFDFGEISNMLFLVIEFVDGNDLHEAKGSEAIDAEVAVTLIRSISSGLAEAHRIGLVHRDIKPVNILINSELVPKLGDFGLAVPDTDIESGLVMGTPAYLAPEVMANPSSASFASDTFALGVILYEMLTGTSIERGDPLDLTLVPNLGDLPKIVRKAVNPKPLLRYQNGEELEEALRDWMRKPKSVGLAVGPSNLGPAAVRPPVQAPIPVSTSSGSGGLFLGLAALLVLAAVAWFAFGKGSDSEKKTGDSTDKTDQQKTVAAPTVSQKAPKLDQTAPEKIPTVGELQTIQKKALEEFSKKIAGERRKNRNDFLVVAGDEGKAFLAKAPNEFAPIPSHFLRGEVEISAELHPHVIQFATFKEMAIDRNARSEILTLHRNAIRDLNKAKAELPPKVKISWQSWVAWLGKNPMEILHQSMAGKWLPSPRIDDFELHLSSTGKKLLIIGEEKFEQNDFLEMTATGEVVLKPSGPPDLHFPWKLQWQGDRLEGEDAAGNTRLMRRAKVDFSNLLKNSSDQGNPSSDTPSNEPVPGDNQFKDPAVADLTEKYRKALAEKIDPLETNYLQILSGFMVDYQDDDLETELEQVEDEIDRIKAIPWRDGFMILDIIPPPGELPKKVAEKESVFAKEFARRFEPIQRTYVAALRSMLLKRNNRGNQNIEDIEKAIKNIGMPEGSVKARFVKIESLPDEGIKHATIAEFNVIDLQGRRLPQEKFDKIKASSFQGTDSDGKTVTTPEKAFDGDSKSIWHSKWKGTDAEFPHWLSFDLGAEHWITGFQLTSRHFNPERSTDITNWRFYVSENGRTWTLAAEGKFRKGKRTNEHLGLKVENED